jgi:LmbE family N-acetylglucosaminyl deacetylase
MDTRPLPPLAEWPERHPLTLLGVWAHPDDETYLSAALMRRVVAQGGRVVLVCATRGEQGTDDPEADRRALGARRERELRAAMSHLGVHDVWVLGHPDGACAEVDVEAAAAPLAAVMAATRPDLVVTFGPDGITNHSDHVAVGHWATRAWLQTQPAERGRLLYAAMTDSFVARHRAAYPEVPLTIEGEAASVPDADVALRVVPSDDEARRKQAALWSHESQIGWLVELLGAERLHDWWLTETFRLPTAQDLAAAAPADVTTPRRAERSARATAPRGRPGGRRRVPSRR